MTHENDIALLDALPSYVSIAPLFKATPATEGDRRFIYVEASNEVEDLQNEIVLAKALEESAAYFARHGNLDLEHYTRIGAKAGIPNYETYEIGLPVDVRIDGTSTFVKGEIYAGDGQMAEKANLFWSSLTDIKPPKRWWTSVGGAVLGKSVSVDGATGRRVGVIDKVRWNNLAFSATPVNANLQPASLTPFGPLAKAWGAGGVDVLKSLTAGYATDSAHMTGGDALRVQSPGGATASKRMSYRDFRDALANDFGSGLIKAADKPTLVREAASRFGLSDAEAAQYVERFLDDLKRGTQE